MTTTAIIHILLALAVAICFSAALGILYACNLISDDNDREDGDRRDE